tara:strand:+ start:138 stop:338 length:201 start_codon:yes stop_codon:yes gene_type:complete
MKNDKDGRRKNNMDEAVKAIARETLGIDTLETRNSDRLDFHELPVWKIREALEIAFRAGQEEPSSE